MTDQTHYEVIIVGGGLTGVMMALALSYGGYGSAAAPAIALVDRAPAQPHSVNTKTAHTESPNSTSSTRKTASGDHRTTTIHAAGKTMLETLGVWPLIQRYGNADHPHQNCQWRTAPRRACAASTPRIQP